MDISTIELEKMFYSGVENLEKIYGVLAEDFKFIEDGDKTLISYVVDNMYQADKLLNERTGVYGVVVRALEISDAALDYYENQYFEEIRQADEKRVTEANKEVTDSKKEAKKLTDTVMKAQAAAKVAPYRRFRNLIRGYCSTCEKSMASLRTTVQKCQAEMFLANKANYRAPDVSQPTSNEPE